MIYPLAIHKDRRSDYGGTFPDLPGCFSAGRTIEEAIEMAREAIILHLDGLREEGLVVPTPKPISRHRLNKAFARAVWAIVAVERLDKDARPDVRAQRLHDPIETESQESRNTSQPVQHSVAWMLSPAHRIKP